MSITAIIPRILATETPELKALFDQRKTLVQQLEALDQSLIKAAQATPTYAFIKSISGVPESRIPQGAIEGNCVAYELKAHALDQRLVKQDQHPSPAYGDRIAQLGEKTINTLLHGKTLSDAEKRKLVSSMLPPGILDAASEDERPV